MRIAPPQACSWLIINLRTVNSNCTVCSDTNLITMVQVIATIPVKSTSYQRCSSNISRLIPNAPIIFSRQYNRWLHSIISCRFPQRSPIKNWKAVLKQWLLIAICTNSLWRTVLGADIFNYVQLDRLDVLAGVAITPICLSSFYVRDAGSSGPSR